MSLKFVNERAVQNIIGDNNYNSDVDASDRDIDLSHAITESDDNFDLEDEEPLSKHAPSSSNTAANASATVKSGKKNARQYRWRAKNIKDLKENTIFIDEDSPPGDDFDVPLL